MKIYLILAVALAMIGCQATQPTEDPGPSNLIVKRLWACEDIPQGDSIIGTRRCTRDDSTSVTWSYFDDSRDDGWQVVTVKDDTIVNVSW